jgi:hypothetical protein
MKVYFSIGKILKLHSKYSIWMLAVYLLCR